MDYSKSPPPPSLLRSQASPPPHSPNYPTEWKYDVFVSYRGEDIKKAFRSHLFDALKERDTDYFWDDDPEGRGVEVRAEIFSAIHRSRVALVVLSPRYADSRWCLDELVEILRCKEEHKVHDHGTILPIFFGVWVGAVKRQEGQFGKAFERVKKGKTKDEVKEWKDALTEIVGLG